MSPSIISSHFLLTHHELDSTCVPPSLCAHGLSCPKVIRLVLAHQRYGDIHELHRRSTVCRRKRCGFDDGAAGEGEIEEVMFWRNTASEAQKNGMIRW